MDCKGAITPDSNSNRAQVDFYLPDQAAFAQWPTPRANENDQGEKGQQACRDGSSWLGQNRGATLTTAAKAQWPTPDVPNGGRTLSPDVSPTGRAPDGSKKQVGLQNAVKLWATPHSNCSTGAGAQGRDGGENIQTQAANWGTPRTSDYKGSGPQGSSSAQHLANKQQLSGQAVEYSAPSPAAPSGTKPSTSSAVTASKGQLAAIFVEWLMSFPPGWTDMPR
jgi:hypothetical protein